MRHIHRRRLTTGRGGGISIYSSSTTTFQRWIFLFRDLLVNNDSPSIRIINLRHVRNDVVVVSGAALALSVSKDNKNKERLLLLWSIAVINKAQQQHGPLTMDTPNSHYYNSTRIQSNFDGEDAALAGALLYFYRNVKIACGVRKDWQANVS